MSKMSHEWMIAARDDLATIESLEDKPSLTHIVAFHAQQFHDFARKLYNQCDDILTES